MIEIDPTNKHRWPKPRLSRMQTKKTAQHRYKLNQLSYCATTESIIKSWRWIYAEHENTFGCAQQDRPYNQTESQYIVYCVLTKNVYLWSTFSLLTHREHEFCWAAVAACMRCIQSKRRRKRKHQTFTHTLENRTKYEIKTEMKTKVNSKLMNERKSSVSWVLSLESWLKMKMGPKSLLEDDSMKKKFHFITHKLGLPPLTNTILSVSSSVFRFFASLKNWFND